MFHNVPEGGYGGAMTEQEPLEPAPRTRTAELSRRLAQALGREEKIVRLSDARAIRAIAHEARQRVIGALYGNPTAALTATQLAELTGLTPSAMSYHLRALEKFGVVERHPDADDARNRPWRSAGTMITISGEDESGRAAQESFGAKQLDELRARLRRAQRLPPDQRKQFTGLATDVLYLDPDQIELIDTAVTRALIELAEAGWDNQPAPGRIRVATVWSLLPEGRSESEGSSAG